MKNLITKIYNSETYQKLVIRPVSMYLLAAMLGFIQIIFFHINKDVFTTAMPMSLLGYKALRFLSIDITNYLTSVSQSLIDQMALPIFQNRDLITIVGFMLGALISSLLRTEMNFKIRKIRWHRLFLGALSGLLIGFGAQGTTGANIGEVFGAISVMSFSGWIIIPILIIAVYAGKPLSNWFHKED